MSLVPTIRFFFLSRQTPTDRSDNDLPSQRLAPPCQGQVEPQFLHFSFFNSSCLHSPFVNLLRNYSEKLRIPGQAPELHSHAPLEILQLITKTARPLWRWGNLGNLDQTPRTQPAEELLPPAVNTGKKQSPDEGPNSRSRQGSPRPHRASPHSLRPRPGRRAHCPGEAATPQRTL